MDETNPNDSQPGPDAYATIVRMLTGHWAVQAIYVAAKLGVPDHLVEGPRSADALAAALDVHAPSLYRILRGLASLGILREIDGRFELTPMGTLLRTDVANSVRDLALMSGEEQYVAWGKLHPAIAAGTTAFKQAYGVEMFGYLGSHPNAARTFDGAMTGLARSLGESLARQYDFSGHDVIVDLGGGRGMFLSRVLLEHAHLRGIVFDLPHVAAGATQALVDYGLADRCEAVGGDFFEQLPGGGDIYVFCQVLFNWDDERALALLQGARSQLPERGVVLVVEQVIAPGSSPFPAMMDLQMLAMPGGRVRTESEYAELASQAGLRLDGGLSLAPLGTKVLIMRPA